MNFMPFESDRYRQAFDRIEKKIQIAQEHKGMVQ